MALSVATEFIEEVKIDGRLKIKGLRCKKEGGTIWSMPMAVMFLL